MDATSAESCANTFVPYIYFFSYTLPIHIEFVRWSMWRPEPALSSLPRSSNDIVTIRLISRDELPQLIALYQHLLPVDAPLPAAPVLQTLWDSMLSDPRLYYIVGDIAEQLVATCNLTIIPNLTRGARPYGIIENVVTHPTYRHQGLGTKICTTLWLYRGSRTVIK